MRALLAATSEGLYLLAAHVAGDYPEVSRGVQQLFDGPVAALAVRVKRSSLQAFALTDSWDELQFNHFHLDGRRVASPTPGFAPTCLIDLDTPSWARAAGTVGAHLYGFFDRSEEEWERWYADHGDDAGVPYDLVSAFDSIPERDTWTQPWGAPPDLRSLAVLRDAESVTVLANAHVGGLASSKDDGRSWTQLVDPKVDVHQVVAQSPELIAIATGARGCGVSRDAGATWTFSMTGLHGSYCRAVAIVGDTLLLSASTGPSSNDGRVYRTSLNESEPVFEPVTGGLPATFEANIDTHHIAGRFSGDDCALVAPDGSIFLSHDAGDSWELAGRVPGTPREIIIT